MSCLPELKPSRFNIEVPLDGSGSQMVLVYNTYNQALAAFQEQTWKRIRSGNWNADLMPHVQGCRDQLFLVDPNLDETRLLMARKHGLAYDTRTLYFKVLVTDHCNFACAYCCEEGFRGRLRMNVNTAHQTVVFILEYIKRHRPEKVFLDFGGGEPLLNLKVMSLIAEQVSLYCRGAGVPFHMAFTTNGSLLSPKVIQRLKQAGLSFFRVTLLPQEAQDHLRCTSKGEPTFAMILNNLKSIKGLTKFHVLAQYESNGPRLTNSISRYLNRLKEQGLEESIEEVNFSPILKREYSIDNPDNFCGELGGFDHYRNIIEVVKEHGFPVPDGPPGIDCLANRKGRMVIDPAGNLIVCPTMLSHRELDVGDVWKGVDPVRESQIIARPLPSSCLEECVLAPRCNGGCRQQALVRSGSFDGIHCNYEFHLAQLKDYLIRRAESFLSKNRDRLAA